MHWDFVMQKPPERFSSGIAPILKNGSIQVYSDTAHAHVNVPAAWLRDHCQCKECVHESTKQRLIETFDVIPSDISTRHAQINEDSNGFEVIWPDGHHSYYAKDWLERAGMKAKPRSAERQGIAEITFWSGDSIKSNPPTVDYEAIMDPSDAGVKEWLSLIRRYGFSYVSNCPVTPEASLAMMERIAFIRPTHYGGFYDFTSDLSKGDTAYTSLAIGAHTDNTYFSDPAGLQLFHLLSHTGGTGGASQLVDGFAAAHDLQAEDADAYETLSSVRVHSHASGNADSSIQPFATFATLVHDPQAGHLQQVRWNTTDRAAIDAPLEHMDAWYDAARKWTTLLRRREYWEQLVPGKPLIFDNWRVLHGRSAFTGKRRICGGYINRDDFVSRYKMTTLGRDEVLRLVAQG